MEPARPARRPPVVLLHGTPFSSWVWRGVARGLAHRFAVHAGHLLPEDQPAELTAALVEFLDAA